MEFELPALQRGDVDEAEPRARRTELPWPALDAMLPPTWSLYLPLSPQDDGAFPEDADVGPPEGPPEEPAAPEEPVAEEPPEGDEGGLELAPMPDRRPVGEPEDGE